MSDATLRLCSDMFCAAQGPHLWHGDPGDFAKLVSRSRGIHHLGCAGAESPTIGACRCWCHEENP